jgi:hypothetical protein
MVKITIDLDENVRKVLMKRAKKNLLTLREQIEDILRRSCVRSAGKSYYNEKVDDKLVGIFSRSRKGRKKKVKKVVKKKSK